MSNRVLRGLQAAALLLGCATVRTEPLHVAVVGGGIGGASAACFLNEEAQARGLELNITLMERSPQIGGRTHTIDFGGLRIDAGATAISTLNEYLVGFVAKWGFDTDADDVEARGEAAGEGGGEGEAAPADELGRAARFGIWDGESFRVDTREGLALPLTVAERYGFSPLRSVSAVREAAGGLGLIYAMQAEGRWFSSPSEMFAALGILNFTQVTAYGASRSSAKEPASLPSARGAQPPSPLPPPPPPPPPPHRRRHHRRRANRFFRRHRCGQGLRAGVRRRCKSR